MNVIGRLKQCSHYREDNLASYRFFNGSFVLLERYEVKVSCTVLRGLGGGNASRLPDKQLIKIVAEEIEGKLPNHLRGIKTLQSLGEPLCRRYFQTTYKGLKHT